MSKVKIQNSFKKSMRTKLLVMGTIPVTILALLVCLGATYGIRKAMTEQQVRELEAVAVAVEAGLDQMAPGDFVIDDEDGCLLKGKFDFSDDDTILDGYVDGSNCEITLFYNGVSYASTMDNGSGRAIGESVSTDISTAIKAGQSVTNTEAEINGVSYVEYFHPIKNSDGTYVGAIFVGVPTEITNHYIGAIVNQIVVVCILVYIISFLCTARLARKINRVINNVKSGVDGIAEGDLNTRFDDKLFEREDELGEMARSAANLRDKLRDIMGIIQQDADLVRKSGLELDGMANSTSGTTQGINSAVEDIAKGSVTQAEDIEVANAKVEEMGNIIDDILNEIKILDETSRSMSTAGTDSARIMQELSKTNDETVDVIAEVAANVKATDESVQRISEAVELITAIADQTNLLSLNASIEAARAGEAGKGFAVVATEIQKLSIESNESASHITEAISTLSHDSKKSMEKMESLHGKLEEQQQKLQETLEKFDQVAVGIDSSRENTNVISAQANDCDSARSTMIALVQNLSAISQENAANSEETTASMQELNATMALLANAAEELREMADDMGEATSYFKL